MIEGLFGYKEVSKNSQNQIILPAEFRDIFEEQKNGGRYYIYMEESRSLLFSILEELMRDLRNADKKVFHGMERNSFTVFSKNVVIVNMGNDGRITLSKEMMEKGGISKEDKKVIVSGANNKLEIWSAARYEEQISEKEVEYTMQKRTFEKDVFKFKLDDENKTGSDGEPDGIIS